MGERGVFFLFSHIGRVFLAACNKIFVCCFLPELHQSASRYLERWAIEIERWKIESAVFQELCIFLVSQSTYRSIATETTTPKHFNIGLIRSDANTHRDRVSISLTLIHKIVFLRSLALTLIDVVVIHLA